MNIRGNIGTLEEVVEVGLPLMVEGDSANDK